MTTLSLSILTPTYNCAHTLPRVWESLKRQKIGSFEWVVIDDGSKDDTRALVERWAKEAPFPVRYFHKANGGKHSAVNYGKRLLAGDYSLIFDSDDALLDGAVETIDHYVSSTGVGNLAGVAGLAFMCTDDEGRPRYPELPSETLQCSMSEAKYRYKLRGEWAVLYKTEVLKATDFPELPNGEYVPESVTYAELSKKYEVIWVNRAIRRYFTNDGEERITDRRGKSEGNFKWPRGKYLRRLSIFNDEIRWFKEDPASFFHNAANLSRFGFHIGRSPRQQLADLSNLPARLLWAIGLLPGVYRYLRDKRRQSLAKLSDACLERGD